MEIKKEKVEKTKKLSIKAKAAALALLGVSAGAGVAAYVAEKPEPLSGDVAVRIEDPEPLLSSSDSSDSICVRDTSSDVTQKLSQMKEDKAPLMGKASAISNDERKVKPLRRHTNGADKSKPAPLGGVPRAPEPNEK